MSYSNLNNALTTVGFADVKKILEDGMAAWEKANGPANLSGHGPTFSWNTKAELLAAVGHGKRLIQPDVIGNGRGNQANLIIDLRIGFPASGRMPLGGPFIPDAKIQVIEGWINAGCPD
ncbi:MAG TPA: hypothetical protein VJ464_15380 [Blastocatellia bacterium]|nr:hypothetical protein [Blastocatellia bacterium]